jgi:hypothetical protein
VHPFAVLAAAQRLQAAQSVAASQSNAKKNNIMQPTSAAFFNKKKGFETSDHGPVRRERVRECS